jgi:hypothetical protein
MKKFVFHKYLKYISSVSEWPSSVYTFNKINLFLLNNNEKKAYELIYHYFNSNLTYKKTPISNKSTNLKSIYINFFNKFILSKLYLINNIINLFYPENNKYLFFSYNDSIDNDKILIKRTLRLNRLSKYRLRRKFYLKSFKNRSVNKLYVSKPEIKYSIKEVIITVYVYNREKFFILKKLSRLNMYFRYILERNKSKTRFSRNNKLKKINYPFKLIKKGIISKLFNLIPFNNINIYNNLSNENMEPNKMFTFYKLNSNKYLLNNLNKIFYMNLKKVFICKYYLGIIYLTNYKFNINNLTELKNKLYKIYKKKININIVNLKYLYLENTIFLDALMNKLNDRKKKALRVIRKGLSLGKIVKLHPLFYREREIEKKDTDKEFIKVDDKLNNLLFNLKKNKYINIISRLKNKHVSGLRVEAKGRLTKRLTASRAVYKISYKGSLKNIYSSYNKLSTLILRGLLKSNTVYVNTNSKNRNGSYGVKYWLSTY